METKMIGNKIAEARKKINISQAQLAQYLFISPQAVGKWERGESMPDITTFNRMTEILGVDLNYFSESFQSVETDVASLELLKQSVESNSYLMPFAKQNVKLRWDMSLGNWINADLSGLKNLQDKFSSSNMKSCKFIDSDMSGLFLKSNNVDSCEFSGSEISSSQIQNSNLVKNIFKDCSLKETKFSGSNIYGCDFSNSNFTGVEFSKSYIYGCDFTSTDFTGAIFKSGGFEKNTIANAVWNRTSFIDTYTADIVFSGTLEDCYFENCSFSKVTFQNAILINTFFKNNKNLKKIKFIECQTDRMTYEFLKSGKADLTGITLLTS
jgi:uncharacterized protein YjbI with pentapeptide repeats